MEVIHGGSDNAELGPINNNNYTETSKSSETQAQMLIKTNR